MILSLHCRPDCVGPVAAGAPMPRPISRRANVLAPIEQLFAAFEAGDSRGDAARSSIRTAGSRRPANGASGSGLRQIELDANSRSASTPDARVLGTHQRSGGRDRRRCRHGLGAVRRPASNGKVSQLRRSTISTWSAKTAPGRCMNLTFSSRTDGLPGRMIKSLLIANRGEIACRIIRTARRLGIRTVAVYSDADAKALHVRMADEAVHIGPSPGARELSASARRSSPRPRRPGAEAIHPGYGFLSENADFAQAVIDAGLIWVGPKPDSIRAMGLKDAAKKLMAEAGVPVTPGYLGEDQAPKRLQKEADAIGYPVLIKAVAGGGGKGMRGSTPPRTSTTRWKAASARRRRSFGDDRVLIEKYILSPAPHRGAGVRRQPRQCRPPVRARLLAAAPPPEGDRGSARAGHGRGDARGGVRRRGARGQGGQLCGRGDDRVHRRRVEGPQAPTASGSWK